MASTRRSAGTLHPTAATARKQQSVPCAQSARCVATASVNLSGAQATQGGGRDTQPACCAAVTMATLAD